MFIQRNLTTASLIFIVSFSYISSQKQQNETQTTTSITKVVDEIIERNNNNYKDSPVSYRSNDNISRQSNYENKPTEIVGDSSDVSATGTTSEYSTEDQSTSGTSTPTRQIADGGSGDHINGNKNVPSRPVSVLSTATTKSFKDDDLIPRPKTAASLVRSSTASSINNSIRSVAASGSIDNISNLGSSRRQSIVDTNANYKSDDALSDVDNLNDEQPPPRSNVTEDEDPDIDEDDRQPDAQSIKSTDTSGGPPAFSEYPDESDHAEQNHTIPTTSPFVRKRNRPPVLLRNRKVSPTKSTVPQLSHGGSKQKANVELFPSNLSRFDRPREAQTTCLNQLDSNNWEETMIGLQSLVRLVRHHSDHIEPQFHLLCVALGKNIKNLRSQVSRASCQAAGEFFETKAKLIEPEADDLALSLLNRTADTNKFLRSDATHALESMCDNLPAPKAIHILTTRGATHQNAIVRTASAKLCCRIVERMGCDRVFALNRDLRDRIIVTGANLLMEGSLETRNHAKMMFKQLSDHSSYNRTLLEVIPARTFRNIEKTLRSIR